MKVSKTFGMTISGAYQSYVFSTTIETDNSEADVDPTVEAEVLTDFVRKATEADIASLLKADPNFAVVYAVRDESLEKQRKLIKSKS